MNMQQFRFPNIKSEYGEFERVAKAFELDSTTLEFLAQEEGRLIDLNDELIRVLENSDIGKIKKGGWETVGSLAREYERDWVDLKEKMEKKIPLDAPIIMKQSNTYHLVSGNTRLMVARALGIIPKVLLFEYVHDRTYE
jgi:hypothetical protein